MHVIKGTVKINAQEVFKNIDVKKTNLKISLFASLVKSTALARAAVIENIKDGGKSLNWPRFSSSTIARKTERGRSLYGLVDTGRMMDSVHESIDHLRLEGHVYPGVNYLKYHEEGTKRIPSRKTFEPVPKQINSRVIDIFKTEILGAI